MSFRLLVQRCFAFRPKNIIFAITKTDSDMLNKNVFRGTIAAIALVFLLVACSEKKETTDIIIEKPVEQAPSTPARQHEYTNSNTIDWLGKSYTCEISRTVADDLPMVKDASGAEYYDNRISLKITRADGSVFFTRVFTKSDFSQYIDAQYLSGSSILGLVFEKADGDNLQFAASVGEPDVLSDDYVPLIITLSRAGDVSIKKDTRLDSPEEPENED